MPGRNISRRLVVGVIGTGLVAAPLLAQAESPAPAAGDEASWTGALLAPLGPGSRFARWTVVAITPLVLGAITVTVKGDDDETFDVEIFARDPAPLAPKPPSETDLF